MKYLIDGYNVAYRMFGPGGRRANSEELRDLVLRRLRRFVTRRRRVTVVFDGVAGRRGTDRVGDVTVVYASDADEEIVRRVREARAPDGWSVVSADRELTGRVRQLGARVVRVIDFLDDLDDVVGPDAEPGEPPQKYDL